MPTTEFDSVWKELDAISDVLTSSNESARIRSLLWARHEWPDWYVELLSQIHLLAGGAQVEYITSSVSDSRIEGDDVYAFTPDIVIHASVTDLVDSPDKHGTRVTTTAWPRAELSKLAVTKLRPYPKRSSSEDIKFPQHLRLELHYPGRPALSLPLPNFSTDGSLEAVYPSLLADLTRSAH